MNDKQSTKIEENNLDSLYDRYNHIFEILQSKFSELKDYTVSFGDYDTVEELKARDSDERFIIPLMYHYENYMESLPLPINMLNMTDSDLLDFINDEENKQLFEDSFDYLG